MVDRGDHPTSTRARRACHRVPHARAVTTEVGLLVTLAFGLGACVDDPCDERMRPLADLDEVAAHGVSGHDVLDGATHDGAPYDAEIAVTLRYNPDDETYLRQRPPSGMSSASLTVDLADGAAQEFRAEGAGSDDGFYCHPRVELPATVTLTTEDGVFRERLDARLFDLPPAASPAGHVALQARFDPRDLRGSFLIDEHLEPSDPDTVQGELRIVWNEEELFGVVRIASEEDEGGVRVRSVQTVASFSAPERTASSVR